MLPLPPIPNTHTHTHTSSSSLVAAGVWLRYPFSFLFHNTALFLFAGANMRRHFIFYLVVALMQRRRMTATTAAAVTCTWLLQRYTALRQERVVSPTLPDPLTSSQPLPLFLLLLSSSLYLSCAECTCGRQSLVHACAPSSRLLAGRAGAAEENTQKRNNLHTVTQPQTHPWRYAGCCTGAACLTSPGRQTERMRRGGWQ